MTSTFPIPEIRMGTNLDVTQTPRLVPVNCDGMEPTLRKGDFDFAVPVDEFIYDSIYVLDFPHDPAQLFRVTHVGGGNFAITRDNPHYSKRQLTVDIFNEVVVGLVVVRCNVVDGRWRVL